MALKGWQIQEIKKILGARREHSLPVTFSVQLFVKAICNEHIFKSPEMILNSVEAEFENQIKDKLIIGHVGYTFWSILVHKSVTDQNLQHLA